IPYNAIVRHMAIGHNQAVFSNDRLVPVRRTLMNGGAFPYRSIVADFHNGLLSIIFKVLWRCRDYGPRKDITILAYSGPFHNGYVGTDPCTVPNSYVIMNSGKWIYNDI